MKPLRLAVSLLALVCLASSSFAQVYNRLTLPSSSLATTEGNTVTISTAVGPMGSGAFTSQFLYSSSLLSAVPVGARISGIRFRLDGGTATGTYPHQR